MSKNIVLYNLRAGHGTTDEQVKVVSELVGGETEYVDITNIEDYSVFFGGIDSSDRLILCGGDGTLNRFVNDTESVEYPCRIFYYPNGTGNDFATDLGKGRGCEPFDITECLRDLPSVTVNGKAHRFINGVGFGIDGYCCEVGDALKESSDKKVNYTSIAIKGLLFHYKPTNARVTVDGEAYEFKNTWLAPTMNGRFYGGGMMPAPEQIRNSGDISVMVYHGKGKLMPLMVFPSLFKGEHVKHTDMVQVLKGKSITVEFDRPVALQIDGETVKNVTSYTANANVKTKTATA